MHEEKDGELGISNRVSRYSIHGMCTFDILDHAGAGVQKLLDVQGRYRCFQTVYDPAVVPDLRVTIGRFQPQLQGCQSLDDVYLVKEDYLYHGGEKYKLGAGWSFEVSGLSAATIELRIAANWLGRPFIAGKIIDFFICYLLLQRGVSLLHASAVASQENVYVFGARGGGGKTTLALAAALDRKLDFLGDNFVLLKDGQVYSYLSDLNMFKYNLHPQVWQSLTGFERMRFNLWLLVYHLSLGYIKVFSPVNPMRFLQAVTPNCGRMYKLSLLRTGWEYACMPGDRQALAAQMINNLRLEFFPFVRHTALFGCVFPQSAFARVWDTYASTLLTNLPETAAYLSVSLPAVISDRVKQQALDEAAR